MKIPKVTLGGTYHFPSTICSNLQCFYLASFQRYTTRLANATAYDQEQSLKL